MGAFLRVSLPLITPGLIATGVLADATAWGEVRRSASFTAGLMHDVGRLAMANAIPDQYAEAVALIRGGIDAVEAEQTVFGIDHLLVGREVAEGVAAAEPVRDLARKVVDLDCQRCDPFGERGASTVFRWTLEGDVLRLESGADGQAARRHAQALLGKSEVRSEK